jgi:hypothetical protein
MKCDSQHTTKDLKKDKTGSWNSWILPKIISWRNRTFDDKKISDYNLENKRLDLYNLNKLKIYISVKLEHLIFTWKVQIPFLILKK